MTEIPKGKHDSPGPCWIPVSYENLEGQRINTKPLIKCNCGKITGIGLHHVHADGVVTASYYDVEASSFTHNGITYQHDPGCGWHVWLKLKDYDCGDFPPEQ